MPAARVEESIKTQIVHFALDRLLGFARDRLESLSYAARRELDGSTS